MKRLELFTSILFLTLFAGSAFAKEVNEITVLDTKVKVGQLTDNIGPALSKLHKYKVSHEFTYKNPNNPVPTDISSTKAFYKVGDKKFYLIISRPKDPGPFKITKIVVDDK